MKLLNSYKIWDKAAHNAFTDLILFKNQWYCTFRESEGHMKYDGQIRLLVSNDSITWNSIALFKIDGKDLRDPKLSITPNNELMINAGIRLEEKEEGSTLKSITYLSSNGIDWSEAYLCESGKNSWRWSTTWHHDTAYSFAYGGNERQGTLYHSKDGKSWKILKKDVYPKATETGNESSIVFNNNQAYVLLRRNKATYSTLLGKAKPPYTKWHWKNLKIPIGGPKMLFYKEKRFLATVRLYFPWMRTSVCWVFPRSGTIKEVLELPSGQDCSYAGMVLQQGILTISYYSSHEGKTSIYLAKVRI